ncbi:MAG: HDOD domain-containing protein [Gemmatimonadetes bacterium]|jgi:two-component system, chemotaxis family, chemotaxis protein CheY|nr:HDOD domain-containing protein [Gemmatimonadota bacterium]MBT6146064.1 HDOD domain-containing protein [Gemmatimonadota bacterium]MBT7863577.1 HDOD domain-containing protein [Gemmatimonadota bacterium]
MMILVVEDASTMRKVVVAMLGKVGFTDIIEAADGLEALEVLRMRQIDLVLTDWVMPNMDGGGLIREIRTTPSYSDLPVVVFSALSEPENAQAARDAGCDAFLPKPFSIAQLKRAMGEAMARRSQEQIQQVILDADPVRSSDEYPLVVIGEKAITASDLGRRDQRGHLRYLSAVCSAVAAINETGDGTTLAGYALESDGAQIARRVRGLPSRIRATMLSGSLTSAVTTARLLSINRPSALTIFVVVDEDSPIDGPMRRNLERMGVVMLRRHQLDAEAVIKLLREHGVDASEKSSELPSPEELQKRLDEDVRATGELPVLAHVFQKITVLDRDQDSQMQDWVDVIKTDPLSSAQVIRRARSPAFGFQGEVSDVDRAVVLLGKNEVKQIVMSGAVKRSMETVTEKGFSVDAYWLHSVAVAVAAQLLNLSMSESDWSPADKKAFEDMALEEHETTALNDAGLWSRFELTPSDDPFVGGIMHDVGKVVLAHSYPGLFPSVLAELEQIKWQKPMSAIEGDFTGGSDHTVVGSTLAAEWDLGTSITGCIMQHHAPHPASPLARLIAVADFVAGALYPFPAEAKYPPVTILATLKQARSEGKDDVHPELPEGFSVFLSDAVTDLKTSRGELLELASSISTAIHRLVNGIQNSV